MLNTISLTKTALNPTLTNMKLILSGSSGFIGREVLSQALVHPSITQIIALSRKPLESKYTQNPKLKVAIVEDFEKYTPEVIEELKGAEGCIWTIGAKSTNAEITRKVTLNYTLAATSVFSQLAKEEGKKFRFVFVSGFLAVKDQNAPFVLFGTSRKVAGETELKLIEQNKPVKGFETYIARPAFVTPKDQGIIKNVVMSLMPSVRVDQLAVALVDAAVNGGQRNVFENADLASRGKEVLAKIK